MALYVVTSFITILANVLFLCIFIRAIMSWIMPNNTGAFTRLLFDATEPVLQPVRRILPPVSGIDFSPILAMVLIQVIQYVLVSLLTTYA